MTSITSDTVQDVGASVLSPSGDLNPGTISINGQREFANSFIVNGSDVEEDVNMGAAIVPNLDSIAEFRILTNNFDAEYGEFSGGQINVVTKSGTNALSRRRFRVPPQYQSRCAQLLFAHARRIRPKPVRRHHSAARSAKIRFSSSPIIRAPARPKASTPARFPCPPRRTAPAICPISASSFVTTDANGNTVPTTVSGPYFAGLLSQKLGYTVTAGEPYYTPGCTSTAARAFSRAP